MSGDEWILIAAMGSILLPDAGCGAVLIALLLLTALRRSSRKRLLRRMSAKPTVTQTAAALVLLPSLVIKPILDGHVYGVVTGVGIWLMIFLAMYASEIMTVRLYSNLLDLMLALSAVAAAYGVYCQFAGILELGRVASIYENPNYYGYAIELTVLAALCQYMRKRNSVYLLVIVLNLLCNVLCDCRSAWVAILASVTVFLLMYFRRLWLLAVAAGAGGVFAFVVRFIPSIGERLTLEAIARSLSNRERYWGNAWRWFRESPLFGRGAFSYHMLSAQEGEKVLVHAHSIYLNILLDVGVVGSVMVLLCFAVQLAGFRRRQPAERFNSFNCLIAATLAATLVHGLTDATVLGVSTAVLFLMILAGAGIRSEEDAAKTPVSQEKTE